VIGMRVSFQENHTTLESFFYSKLLKDWEYLSFKTGHLRIIWKQLQYSYSLRTSVLFTFFSNKCTCALYLS